MNVNDNIIEGQYVLWQFYYQFMYQKVEKHEAIHQLQNVRVEQLFITLLIRWTRLYTCVIIVNIIENESNWVNQSTLNPTKKKSPENVTNVD